jgi:preprotein translocase subunit YajC
MIKQYDHVKLKSGKHAIVVEIWEQGVAYEADIEIEPGEYQTETIYQKDIASVFVEVETPLSQVV